MVDFYFKTENDLSYRATALEEKSQLQNLMSQIKMMIFTNQTEVLGDIQLGLNIEKLIFETNYNKYIILDSIKKQMRDYIRYDRNLFDLNFDLNFYTGTVRDIAVLTVNVNAQRMLDILIK